MMILRAQLALSADFFGAGLIKLNFAMCNVQCRLPNCTAIKRILL